ncbi:hypothetical protein TNCT_614941 [Trichonephila clavata]|uniref:Uncharacterized protein n=1 Tax=Trichonephila clavata TaxID=2740835 RepID=A0A8X6EXU7_TRICU|nr:hypothetical protein TNCT_614941 [Trichonephila clavata]
MSSWEGLLVSTLFEIKKANSFQIISREPNADVDSPFRNRPRGRVRQKPIKTFFIAKGAHRSRKMLTPKCDLVSPVTHFGH